MKIKTRFLITGCASLMLSSSVFAIGDGCADNYVSAPACPTGYLEVDNYTSKKLIVTNEHSSPTPGVGVYFNKNPLLVEEATSAGEGIMFPSPIFGINSFGAQGSAKITVKDIEGNPVCDFVWTLTEAHRAHHFGSSPSKIAAIHPAEGYFCKPRAVGSGDSLKANIVLSVSKLGSKFG